MSQTDTAPTNDTETLQRTLTVRPWTVVFVNDDRTPMNFVTEVLMSFMHLPQAAAEVVMLTVHEEGRANVGTFSREVAETKVVEIMDAAQAYGYPLQVSAEPVS